MSPVTHYVRDFVAHGYSVRVSCPCGHVRIIPGEWIVLMLGRDFRFDDEGTRRFKQRLRCSKCGRRDVEFDYGRF